MNISLKNKKALVCGSTQGIGKAIAISLAQAGAEITCMARNESALFEIVNRLEGDQHQFLVADFADFDSVLKHENTIKSSGFDILINNAGGPPPGKASESEWEDFEKAIDMHLKVSHHLMKWVTPSMKESGYGRILNIISTSVRIPIPGLGVSNTVRGAMASWSKTISNELAPFGITVNNILPGPINTGRLQSIIESQATKKNISVSESEAGMKSSVPAGRFGESEEIANLAVFLSSDKASYINGVNIPVDGGRTGSI